jgi:hypothetical protein
MDDEGGGGLELAWILWTALGALFVIFGVVALAGTHHPITFWLLAGLLFTNCSAVAWGVSLQRRLGRSGQTGHHTHTHLPNVEPGETLEGELSDGPFKITKSDARSAEADVSNGSSKR